MLFTNNMAKMLASTAYLATPPPCLPRSLQLYAELASSAVAPSLSHGFSYRLNVSANLLAHYGFQSIKYAPYFIDSTMSRRLSLFISATLGLWKPAELSPPPAESIKTIVDLGYSRYQGISLCSGVNQFLGMRYAAPPLGKLRFRAPKLPLWTSGLQSAVKVRTLRLYLKSD
jgi:hypothetical protein